MSSIYIIIIDEALSSGAATAAAGAASTTSQQAMLHSLGDIAAAQQKYGSDVISGANSASAAITYAHQAAQSQASLTTLAGTSTEQPDAAPLESSNNDTGNKAPVNKQIYPKRFIFRH